MLTTDDIVAIQQLEAFCHHAVDHHDQSLFPLVFAPDARFDGRLCGGPLCVGMEETGARFVRGKPPPAPCTHMNNGGVREVNGKVLVKMKWIVPELANGTFVGGDNDDIVVRTPDGWRIWERKASVRYPGEMTVPRDFAV